MPVMETPFAMYDALTSIEVPPEKVRVVVKSMESDMALFATSTQFNQLDQYSGSRFDMLRAEIAASRERVELVDKRFEQVDKRFEQVHAEIAAVREQLSDKFQLLQSAMLAVGKSVDDLSRNLENRLLVRVAVMLGGTVLFLGGLMALLKG
jgi:septal ring factor EnvC (AmiA/AmiB activator)